MERLKGMIKDNHGISLIEVLAVITILSLVFLLISSFNIFSQKQFTNQTSQIDNQANIRLAINIITKEIRSVNPDETIVISDNVLTINDTTVYKLEKTTFTKDGNNLITGIEDITIQKEGSKVDLSITSIPNNNGKRETLSTVIYIRE